MTDCATPRGGWDDDPEEFCPACFAGLESPEHYEKCVWPAEATEDATDAREGVTDEDLNRAIRARIARADRWVYCPNCGDRINHRAPLAEHVSVADWGRSLDLVFYPMRIEHACKGAK